jgi:anti-anti-sigma factor
MAGRFSSSTLRIRSTRDGDVHTIALAGELDFAVIGEVEAVYAEIEASDAEHIVLDLSKLEFADCSVVTLLMDLAARSGEEGDRLALRRGPAHVQRVFELTDTSDSLPFVDE